VGEGLVTLTIQILLLASLAVYARAGLVALRRPISDFYVAGRLVPAIFNGMVIAIGLGTMIALTGFAGALSQGWDGASLLVLGGAAGLLLAGFFVSPYLRKFGGYTVPDFLGERFGGAAVRPLAVLAVILCSFPALALALMGLGALTMRVFAVDAGAGLAIGVGMLLLCSVVAGLRSASLTQIAQYAVLIAVSLPVLAILIWQRGAVFPLVSAADLDTAFAASWLASSAPQDSVNRFALLFSLGAGTASLPLLLQRGFTTSSVEEARSSFLWALPFAGALCLVAAPYVPLFGATDAGLMLSARLAIVGGIAACLAAASGLVLAIANALSYDIYYKSLHLTASTEQRILAARTAVVLVAGLAAWAALAAPEAVFATTGSAFSLAASTFLPAILLGIWWKRATPEGALAGMLAGLGVCLYYMLAPRYIPFGFYESSSFLSNATQEAAARYDGLRQSFYLADEGARAAALAAWEEAARPLANWGGVSRDFAGVFAVPIGLITMIGVSLFTPAPSRDVQSFVEELRKPQPV
jgi:cation/acetate symporter